MKKLMIVAMIACATANAGVISLVTSPSQLAANDSVDWGQLGNQLVFVPSPSRVTSAHGLGMTLTGAGLMRRFDQKEPGGWNGFFLPGDKLLHPYDTITIVFDSPVRGLGAQYHHDWLNVEATGRLEAFDADGNSMGAVMLASTMLSITPRGQGTAPFFGLMSTERDIAGISWSSFAPIPPPDRFGNATKFAVGSLQLMTTEAGVPEPGSAALLISGVLGIAGFGLRRSRYSARSGCTIV